jgi:hypothetical protein
MYSGVPNGHHEEFINELYIELIKVVVVHVHVLIVHKCVPLLLCLIILGLDVE